MKGRFKYIIVPAHGSAWAILMPECINHCDAVNPQTTKVLGAGFCTIAGDEVTVEGHSTSLNISAKPADATAIILTLSLIGVLPMTEEALQKIYLPQVAE